MARRPRPTYGNLPAHLQGQPAESMPDLRIAWRRFHGDLQLGFEVPGGSSCSDALEATAKSGIQTRSSSLCGALRFFLDALPSCDSHKALPGKTPTPRKPIMQMRILGGGFLLGSGFLGFGSRSLFVSKLLRRGRGILGQAGFECSSSALCCLLLTVKLGKSSVDLALEPELLLGRKQRLCCVSTMGGGKG